jgi:hypothetical protein
LGERRLGRPFARWAASPCFPWPPLRLARMCRERESVGVVCPPGLPRRRREEEAGNEIHRLGRASRVLRGGDLRGGKGVLGGAGWPAPGAGQRGWPRRLVVNRRGADARRERVLRDIPTREGFDRDEYPPAVGRGRGPGLERGRNPRSWKADVRYVPSSENRSHGATLGDRLEPSATAPAFATCSADSLSCSPPPTDAEVQAHRPARPPRQRRIGSSLVARVDRSRCGAHAGTGPMQRLCGG